jgi:hypothetical protein
MPPGQDKLRLQAVSILCHPSCDVTDRAKRNTGYDFNDEKLITH